MRIFIYKFLKVGLFLVCLLLFIFAMALIGRKFQDSHWVATAQSEEDFSEMKLPQATLCATNPFKGPGNVALPSDFAELAYGMPEMGLEVGQNWSLTLAKKGLRRGQCYTLANPTPVFANSFQFSFSLMKGLDYDLYLHPSLDDTYWITFDQFKLPDYVTKVVLFGSHDEVNIRVAKIVQTRLASAHSNGICVDELTDDFEACFMAKVKTELIKASLICLPSHLATLNMDTDVPECTNSSMAMEVIEYAAETASALMKSSGCSKSCTTEKFLVDDVEYARDFSGQEEFSSQEEGKFKVAIFFDKLTVAHSREFYLYDSIEMAMAVGGIMALLLGFSILSMLLDCVDVLYLALGNRDIGKITLFKRSLRL